MFGAGVAPTLARRTHYDRFMKRLRGTVVVVRHLLPGALAAGMCIACAAPSQTTTVEVNGKEFKPASTLYAQFDASVGGSILTNGSREHFAEAIAFDAEVTCASIDEDNCDAIIGDGAARLIVDVVLKESLFGPATLGDYDLDAGGSWDLISADHTETLAESGKVRLYQVDDDAMAADYTVEVGGEEVTGSIVGERCAALEKALSNC